LLSNATDVGHVQLEEGLGARPVLAGSATELREAFAGLGAMLGPLYPPATDAVTAEEGASGNFKYTVFTPVEASKKNKALPVGIYYHGGGFVLPPGPSDNVLCSKLAEGSSSIVVLIKYRLSPEVKAPAHFQDVVDGTEWVSFCHSLPNHYDVSEINTGD
jgi:versiconal hemiacetal acetate esterase